MALHWNIEACENVEQIKQELTGTLECLCFALMFTGLAKIEAEGKESWREAFTRVRMWETAMGPISSSGEPLPASAFRRFVGLRTNSSPMTPRQFSAHLGKAMRRKAEDALAKELDQ